MNRKGKMNGNSEVALPEYGDEKKNVFSWNIIRQRPTKGGEEEKEKKSFAYTTSIQTIYAEPNQTKPNHTAEEDEYVRLHDIKCVQSTGRR